MTVHPTAPALGELARLRTLVEHHAAAPSGEGLRALHDAVRRAPGFDVGLELRRPAADLLRRGDHAGVARLVAAAMPGAFLSPAAHRLWSRSLAALGDSEGAAREDRQARLALRAILGSGAGTSDQPWRVLRVSDEYDVLEARGLTSREQRVVERDDRLLDVHRCAGEEQVWFELVGVTVRPERS